MRQTLAPYAVRALLALQLVIATSSAQATTVILDPADSPLNDIVALRGGFNDTSLLLGVDFRSGTVDFSDVVIVFELDTDENPATGSVLGAEFFVSYDSRVDLASAAVVDQSSGTIVDSPATRLGTDSLDLTVPLASLGGDDGVMNFGVSAGQPVGTSSFVRSDFTPKLGDRFALGGPTTAVPEPTAALAFAAGVLVIAQRLGRRAPRT